MKKIISAIAIITVFVAGFAAGKQTAIKSAELYDITSDGYSISYGGEIHDYINLD